MNGGCPEKKGAGNGQRRFHTAEPFFTRNTFRQIIEDGESPAYADAVHKIIASPEGRTNRECVCELYQKLKTSYQNEYFYKNTLLNKLLLGVHSLHTTTALAEVPVGKSKADFILINGKAVVYEIKTALDNFERLDGQLENYYKAFSAVVVVTSESGFDKVQQKLLGSPAGICVLTPKGTLSTRKKATEYSGSLSKSVMFRMLRKKKYEHILCKVFGSLPEVSQFEYYRTCQAMFEALPAEKAHRLFVQELKERVLIDVADYSNIPYELKYLAYFSNYKKSDYTKICHFLSI